MTGKNNSVVNKLDNNNDYIYTSRIIKASALIPDTKVLLKEWDLSRSVEENLNRARNRNIFGKDSRKRINDILRIFQQRYFEDKDIGEALVALVQSDAPNQWIEPLLYFFSAQSDRLLKDIVIQVLYQRYLQGLLEFPKDVVIDKLRTWVAEGKMASSWNDTTLRRVARGVMATLKDFNVLEGKLHKKIQPIFLPNEAFSLIALWMKQEKTSGEKILKNKDWRLFFLEIENVERFFIEAQQLDLLQYHAAGSIIRIDFPVDRLKEYAHDLVEEKY